MKAIIKYPGAKWSYANWIVSFMPEHTMYIEPYFGSGAVFFNKAPSRYETINDLDGLVVNFFRVCRDHPDQLARAINLTPYSREEFKNIQEDRAGDEIHVTGNSIEDARRFAVRCSQSFGAKIADRSGWKNTKAPNGPALPKIWSGIPETIYQIANRLKNAQIENTDAIQLIKDTNHPQCLVYADPPYLGRVRNNTRLYRMEAMDEESHEQLLHALLNHKGMVMLSGYDNDLYNDLLAGWHKEYKQGHSNNASKRTEVLWMNFDYQLRL